MCMLEELLSGAGASITQAAVFFVAKKALDAALAALECRRPVKWRLARPLAQAVIAVLLPAEGQPAKRAAPNFLSPTRALFALHYSNFYSNKPWT